MTRVTLMECATLRLNDSQKSMNLASRLG